MEPPDPNNPISLGLQYVLESGFDQSTLDEDGFIQVQCSQCAAVSINGVACHEHGCPNRRSSE